MPTRQTLAYVETFWVERLGCSAQDLHRPGVTLLPNGGNLAAYRGAFLLRWDAACIFTVPASLLAPTAAAMHGRPIDHVFDAAFLADLFAAHLDRVVGPAFQGCADASDFRPVKERGTRVLALEEDTALERLAVGCGPEAWEHSAIARGQQQQQPIFGCFAGTELVAAGTLQAWGPHLRSVGIVTHPAYRGRGYGRAVVATMTAYALDGGYIPQYQTLMRNTGSLGIAHALGYQQYATTIAVRLADLLET
jgi:GNAT superfamily N-acetyltransferase